MDEDARQEEDSPGPYVVSAFMCRKAKPREMGQDIEFMTTQFYFSGPATTPPPIPMHLVVGFACGDFVGEQHLTVERIRPSGERATVCDMTMTFGPPNLIEAVTVQMKMPLDEDGLTWFDVRLDGQLKTRVPFWIERKPNDPVADRPSRPRRRQYRLASSRKPS